MSCLFNCNEKECDIYPNSIPPNYNDNFVKKTEIEPENDNDSYRYLLKIEIDPKEIQKQTNIKFEEIKDKKSTMAFVLMNPSHANKDKSDHTINNCIEIAGYHGYHNLEIYNLSPIRTPDPEKLIKIMNLECNKISNKTEANKKLQELKEYNDKKLEEVINSNKNIVIAWGGLKNKILKEIAKEFLKKCKNKKILCITQLKSKDNYGAPLHACRINRSKYKKENNNNLNWGELTEFDLNKYI